MLPILIFNVNQDGEGCRNPMEKIHTLQVKWEKHMWKVCKSMRFAATLKHYIAYGVPEGGLNLAPAHIGEREIREVMLEPFQKCITD